MTQAIKEAQLNALRGIVPRLRGTLPAVARRAGPMLANLNRIVPTVVPDVSASLGHFARNFRRWNPRSFVQGPSSTFVNLPGLASGAQRFSRGIGKQVAQQAQSAGKGLSNGFTTARTAATSAQRPVFNRLSDLIGGSRFMRENFMGKVSSYRAGYAAKCADYNFKDMEMPLIVPKRNLLITDGMLIGGMAGGMAGIHGANAIAGGNKSSNIRRMILKLLQGKRNLIRPLLRSRALLPLIAGAGGGLGALLGAGVGAGADKIRRIVKNSEDAYHAGFTTKFAEYGIKVGQQLSPYADADTVNPRVLPPPVKPPMPVANNPYADADTVNPRVTAPTNIPLNVLPPGIKPVVPQMQSVTNKVPQRSMFQGLRNLFTR